MICTKITGAQERVTYKIAGWGHQGRFLEEGKGDPYSGRVIDACRRKAGGWDRVGRGHISGREQHARWPVRRRSR